MRLVLNNPINYYRNFLFYKQFIGKNKIFFDIGANIGDRTKIFKMLGVQVVAVEPQSVCFKKLQAKFSKNKNIFLVNKGVGSEVGSFEMQICSSNNVLSTLSKKWQEGRFKDFKFDKTENIELTTLENLIEIYGVPDFCKIDVEGYELEVVKGLKTKIPYISFEFTSEFFDEAMNVIEKLLLIGFNEFNFVDGEKNKLYFDVWVGRDSLLDVILRKIKINKDFWGDIYAR